MATALECLRAWWYGHPVESLPALPASWRPGPASPGDNPAGFLRLARQALNRLVYPLINAAELADDRDRTASALQDAGAVASAWLDWSKRYFASQVGRHREWTRWREWRADPKNRARETVASMRWGYTFLADRLRQLLVDPWNSESLRRTIGPWPLTVRPPRRHTEYPGLAVDDPASVLTPSAWDLAMERGGERGPVNDVAEQAAQTWRHALQLLGRQPELETARMALMSSRWFPCFAVFLLLKGGRFSTNDGSPLGGWLADLEDDPALWPAAAPVVAGFDWHPARDVANRWRDIAPVELEPEDFVGRHDGDARAEEQRRAVPAFASLIGWLVCKALGPAPTRLDPPAPDLTGTLGEALAGWRKALLAVEDLRGDGPQVDRWWTPVARAANVAAGRMPLAWPHRAALIRGVRRIEATIFHWQAVTPLPLLRRRVRELDERIATAMAPERLAPLGGHLPGTSTDTDASAVSGEPVSLAGEPGSQEAVDSPSETSATSGPAVLADDTAPPAPVGSEASTVVASREQARTTRLSIQRWEQGRVILHAPFATITRRNGGSRYDNVQVTGTVYRALELLCDAPQDEGADLGDAAGRRPAKDGRARTIAAEVRAWLRCVFACATAGDEGDDPLPAVGEKARRWRCRVGIEFPRDDSPREAPVGEMV